MTNLMLVRTACRPDGILGTLYDAEGEQLAVTLEHSYNGVPKLKTGSLLLVRSTNCLKVVNCEPGVATSTLACTVN